MERLLTEEEKKRLQASRPSGRAFQLNGATVDPFVLLMAEKRNVIRQECLGWTLALSGVIALGAYSKE
ncbi:hypothetical protein Naga_101900g2 [Nannochloropsis gaditana]|uniref:Uncharacterized protein n=1 Tax=Nannochloropsis gaditana TaxID=72520 RepID=W7TS97_9STRA|nr:hypothetical protein Naga_101900g2 [Nannochloropsis gaditana]